MSHVARDPATLTDLRPGKAQITADVVAGLSRLPKRLPSKYFYDARGSALFEQITHQPEYTLTRAETALLGTAMPSIATHVGDCVQVVEYGSGSGRKTERLLEGLPDPVAYTPIEISRAMLLATTARLAQRFPTVQMLPVCADFTRPVALPGPDRKPRRVLVFFPGSTLGNFEHAEAVSLLAAMRDTMGAGGLALIGIDMEKDTATLEAAYNDAAGVTAAFTLNLLARLNREIGSDFDLDAFHHRAVYDRANGRIHTSLVSAHAQEVRVDGRRFHFDAGEAMDVEFSHKYTDARFDAMALAAGLAVTAHWDTDDAGFSLRLLRAR